MNFIEFKKELDTIVGRDDDEVAVLPPEKEHSIPILDIKRSVPPDGDHSEGDVCHTEPIIILTPDLNWERDTPKTTLATLKKKVAALDGKDADVWVYIQYEGGFLSVHKIRHEPEAIYIETSRR